MRKQVAIPIIASIIGSNTPSSGIANDQSIYDVDNQTHNIKTGIATILSQKSNIPDNIQKAIHEARESIAHKEKKEINNPDLLLFPVSVQTVGIDRITKSFLGNMNYIFNEVNPILVDVAWEDYINCAATMRGFIRFSSNNEDRTKEELDYINKQGVDAWMLPNELKKLGYKQEINLMDYFDTSRVGNNEIVNDENGYKNKLLETGMYLKDNGVPGSILFIYFNLSNYKGVVRDYNAKQKLSNPNYTPHINTHQAMYLGNSFKEFQADEVKDIYEGELRTWQQIDVINYIASFVQQRGGYVSALKNAKKTKIIENISFYHPLIEITVNGQNINLAKELGRSVDQRIQIKPSDIIRITGPVLADGFHNVNSSNKAISEKNNVRAMFIWEFYVIGDYTPSELMVPKSIGDDKSNSITKSSDFSKQLEITNSYSLKPGENIDLKLKEAILRYKLGKHHLLKESDAEINDINRIIDNENSRIFNSLVAKYNAKREKKIDDIIESLNKDEKAIFWKEYDLQIKGLQMMGYMQHPGLLNQETTNINAPIFYFNSTSVESIFPKYIEKRKQEISSSREKNVDTSHFISIYFYPDDNFAKVFNQLKDILINYKGKYPNFAKLEGLESVKQNKFIDIIIDKFFQDNCIDISNGKIPSMKTTKIPLDFIDKILETVLNETYVEKLTELSYVDNAIIERIAKTEQDRAILAYIIIQETYEQGLPIRKWSKKIGSLFGKTSSSGDFQLKIFNLLSKNNSLLVWPNVEQIQKAISYLDDEEIKLLIDRRHRRFGDVESDLKLVAELKTLLTSVNETNRVEIGKQVYDIFKEMFKFNDARAINIVGKVIQASLTQDKVHELEVNLNAWFNNSGISLEEIHYNTELQKRYYKTLLVMYNRGEGTTLVGIGENYVLRCLETLGQDVYSDLYPKLKKSDLGNIDLSKINDFDSLYKVGLDYITRKISGHIDYDKEKIEHFDFYKGVVSSINGLRDDETVLFKEELLKEIINIQASNYSSNSIYKLFRNERISNYLKKHNGDSYPIPSLSELENTAFRRLFFDYAKTPVGRTSPKIYDFKQIATYAGGISLVGLAGLIGIFRKFRKMKKSPEKYVVKEEKSVHQILEQA